LWYQVDEGDTDLATFFYYLGRAIPRSGRSLPLLTPEHRRGIAAFSRRFFRELTARFHVPFALILDNYQQVPRKAALHDVLRHALQEIPEHGRLIVVSRGASPASLARQITHGTIELVDWDDLRFTVEEARELLRLCAPGRWPLDLVRSLHAAADGWGAGLVLLARQYADGPAPTRRRSPPSADVLFEYFAGEIFKNAAAPVRDVLLQTAFLPSVTAAMAERLTGSPRAGNALVQLHHQNYFTNRRSETEPVYEYHPLFRTFLMSQATRSYSKAQCANIRRRAAQIADEADMVDAAVSLLRDADDWPALAALIGRRAPELLAQGRGDTVERWLELLPEPLLHESPWLLYWRALCWLTWRHAESQRDLEEAFTRFRERRDAAGTFLTWSTILIALQGESNTTRIDEWMRRFDELIEDHPTFPSTHVEARVSGAMLAAIVLRQPRHPDGERWAERALALSRQDGDLAFRGITAHNWVCYHSQLGNLAKASAVVEEMRALTRAPESSPVVAVTAALGLSWYEMLTVMPSYRATVSEALKLARESGMFHTVRLAVLGTGVFAALHEGDLETAETWSREFGKDLSRLGPGFRGWYYEFQVRLALAREDLQRAALLRPEMLRGGIAGGWCLYEAQTLLISAMVRGRCCEKDEARADLDRALQIADTMQSPYVEFMARLVEAELCFGTAHEAEALKALRSAMALGRSHGFVNTLIWEPQSMARLCARALEAGIEVDYVRGLIQTRRLTLDDPGTDVDTWPWPVKVLTFGPFEIHKQGRPVTFSAKVQRKPIDLLKLLIALGGRRVREERLIDALWPDAAGDSARFALTTTIYRLRRLLGDDEIVARQGHEVTLNERLCWVDLAAVRRLIERAEAIRPQRAEDWLNLTNVVQRITRIYRGPFLDDDAGMPYTQSVSDEVRGRTLNQIVRVASHHQQHGRVGEAIEAFELGQRVDPCSEDVCRGLMTCYEKVGRLRDAESAYRRTQENLGIRFGVAPARETRMLLQRLRSGQNLA
jgi:DNA-binding SARP family transcriptional activator